jgi:hypothetical protein
MHGPIMSVGDGRVHRNTKAAGICNPGLAWG